MSTTCVVTKVDMEDMYYVLGVNLQWYIWMRAIMSGIGGGDTGYFGIIGGSM
jgi:hypothetical protein